MNQTRRSIDAAAIDEILRDLPAPDRESSPRPKRPKEVVRIPTPAKKPDRPKPANELKTSPPQKVAPTNEIQQLPIKTSDEPVTAPPEPASPASTTATITATITGTITRADPVPSATPTLAPSPNVNVSASNDVPADFPPSLPPVSQPLPILKAVEYSNPAPNVRRSPKEKSESAEVTISREAIPSSDRSSTDRSPGEKLVKELAERHSPSNDTTQSASLSSPISSPFVPHWEEPLPPPVVTNEQAQFPSFDFEESSGRWEAGVELRSTTAWLAAAYLLLAVVGAIPAILQILNFFQDVNGGEINRWSYLVLGSSVLLLAFALYLVQLPDWSSLWVATFVTLMVASTYAMFTGLTLSSRYDGELIEYLQLTAQLPGRRAAGWCFVMLTLSGGLAYLSGRVATRWRREVWAPHAA